MPLVFNRDFDPRHGEPVQMAPGVRRVTAPNAGPFTFRGTNTFLIGAGELTVLDPGPADPAHLEALRNAIGSAQVRQILVSHSHSDHTPAARLLQAETGAPILAALRRAAPPPEPGAARLDAGGDADFRPDTLLRDGAVVAAGGCRLEAIATPGHASDHFVFALLGTDILFSGDHVMGWSTTVIAPPDGAMADYMTSLDRLLARPEGLYLPAHGAEIRNAHLFVRGLKAHRKMRERAILERLAAGDRSILEIVPRIYGGLDPRLSGAAALSTLAHLLDLVERDLVASGAIPGLHSHYWLSGSATGAGGDGDTSASGSG